MLFQLRRWNFGVGISVAGTDSQKLPLRRANSTMHVCSLGQSGPQKSFDLKWHFSANDHPVCSILACDREGDLLVGVYMILKP